MAIVANNTSIVFNDSSVQTTAFVGSANTQTFNTTGTWTKPGGVSMARIQIWGAGGGGGGDNRPGGPRNGGGGGAYMEVICPVSYLASTVTATVGTGGSGIALGTGGSGGTSTFTLSTAINGRTTFSAYGGQGAGGNSGYGGGSLGTPTGVSYYFDVGGYDPNQDGSGREPRVWGGGIGAYSEPSQSTYYGAASSFYGGGGGGGQNVGAGSSFYGGAGGGSGSAGTAPGGGGGYNAAGAAGRIVVTCW